MGSNLREESKWGHSEMTELAISRVKGFANVASNVLPESWFKNIRRET
jgi:hypothetical protein